MSDTIPVRLRNGKIALVPQKDIEDALADPAADPSAEILRRAGLIPVRLESGEIANVPITDYQQARGDPLAARGQGQTLVPVPLANGTNAMVPRGDAMTAMQDPLSAYGASAPQGDVMTEQMDPQMMALLKQYMDEGRLDELFQPFQQEQNVLDQQMQLAQGLRQRGQQRSTPMGALFSGLSNALGNTGGALLQQRGLEGQAALGKRQQEDASGRVGAILREMQRRKGTNPSTELMPTDISDSDLANLFSGGQ